MLLRKTTKKDIIGSVLIKSPPELKGSVFIYGRIGSGKTTAMLSLAQRYRDILNYKIVDLFGGHRNENLYWCLPSRDVNYWDKIKKMISSRKDQEGSKQYNVNLLYPLFTKQLPKKLPANPPYVKSKLFTIPFRDISFDEIKLVINNVTEPMKYYWNEILDRSNKKTLIVEVEELIYKLKAEKTNLYRSFIKPLVGEGFLQSEKCSYNIDILGEMKDKNTVTVLCLDFISPTYHLFIMNYFLRKVKEYLDKGRLSTKNIFLFREVSDFFKTSDDSIMEDKFKYFRRLLSMYIRYSRRGMHFFLETQSPWEVRGLVEGCLLETTKIKIPNGDSISLKDLPKFFNVISYNFNTGKIEHNIAKKIFKGEKECYKIKFENGEEIIATGEHNFFSAFNKKVKVRNLKVGESLIFIEQDG